MYKLLLQRVKIARNINYEYCKRAEATPASLNAVTALQYALDHRFIQEREGFRIGEATMTWEEKLDAIQSLKECPIRMRQPGDWYTYAPGIETKNGSEDAMLCSVSGNGADPYEAIADYWLKLTAPDVRVIVDAGSASRREYIWSGFMWKEIRP